MGSKLKVKRKSTPIPTAALGNVANYSTELLAKTLGTKAYMLDMWIKAREQEMDEAYAKKYLEKLKRAEDSAAFVNLLITMYAVKMTWGYTKAIQRLIDNLNPAHEYIRRIGLRAATEQITKETGIDVDFDDFEIEQEVAELARKHGKA